MRHVGVDVGGRGDVLVTWHLLVPWPRGKRLRKGDGSLREGVVARLRGGVMERVRKGVMERVR